MRNIQCKPEQLGELQFKNEYSVKYALYAGGMANGISSVNMVKELSENGFIGVLGIGGWDSQKIENSIDELQSAHINFIVNVMPQRAALEKELINLLIRKKVCKIEASAYIDPTPALVLFRVKGIFQNSSGETVCKNKLIAKVSREEVALNFFMPPKQEILDQLFSEEKITVEEYKLAVKVPVASDITVEADSGGHTDNRALISILPEMITLRDQIQDEKRYTDKVRVGAAGGISSGAAAAAAYSMGAAYVVTGSINQSCIEAGTSEYVKKLLCTANSADVIMAPAADTFERGGKVQVLRKHTMYSGRAEALFRLYRLYNSYFEIEKNIRNRLENQFFRASFEEIWSEVIRYYEKKDKELLKNASNDSKMKMTLVFKWYLASTSQWAISGEEERKYDMQIWCGPSMGVFNKTIKNTILVDYKNRKVSEVNLLILKDAAMQIDDFFKSYRL